MGVYDLKKPIDDDDDSTVKIITMFAGPLKVYLETKTGKMESVFHSKG